MTVPPASHRLLFRLVDVGGALEVRITVDDEPTLAAPFDDEWRVEPDLAEILVKIESGVATLEDLKTIGSRLWASLSAEDCGGPLRQRIRDIRARQRSEGLRVSIGLELPPGLDALPWESLYDLRGSTFLACDPRCVVTRAPQAEGLPFAPRKKGRLRMLVVIPEGSGLRVEHERDRIEFALQPVANAIEGGRPRVLHERVTPDKLAAELRRGYDVVHFIGHGTQDDDGVASIRLNAEDGGDLWTPADAFVSLFHGADVGLVFLNCCLSGQPSTRAGFSGLGPMLLANGVPAVVAMRYEVPDDVAIKLATVFYQELVTGAEAGRVDLALQFARQAVLRNLGSRSARAITTPLCFLAPCDGPLFAFDERARSGPAQAPRTPSTRIVKVPDALVAAVREGRCIPVLGSGLLHLPRSGEAPSAISIRLLARRLAEQSNYPEMDDLSLAERAGEWLNLLILQRVCQHFEQERERYELTNAVLSARGARVEPPPVYEAIARWQHLPGLVCTYFDGLAELAFERQRRRFSAVHAVDERHEAAMDPSLSLVVCLRGSAWNADSLVLTVQDHDGLWERMTRPNPEVTSLVTGKLGRCLLFLGVSPRDSWVRRFIRHLLPPSARNVGPAFFVGERVSGVDKASWEGLKEKWKIHWIEEDPAEFVDALTLRAGGPGGT